jgi:hypothetical protein
LHDPGVEEIIADTKKEDHIRYFEFEAWAYQSTCRTPSSQVNGEIIAA